MLPRKKGFHYDLLAAHDRDKIKGQINIGIIGCNAQRSYLKKYLLKIHKPVSSVDGDVARLFFPGLDAAFGIHINFENIVEIDIPDAEVKV